MIKSRIQEDAGNLVDLVTPLTDYDLAVLRNVYGQGPLEPNAVERRPLHKAGCACIECWNAGLRYGEYLKAKGLMFP